MPKGPRLGGVKHGCRASARYSTPVNNLPSQPAAGLPACCPLRERHITTAAPPPPPPPPPLPPTPYTHLLPTHPATPTPPTPRARRVAAGVSQGRVGERGTRAPAPAGMAPSSVGAMMWLALWAAGRCVRPLPPLNVPHGRRVVLSEEQLKVRVVTAWRPAATCCGMNFTVCRSGALPPPTLTRPCSLAACFCVRRPSRLLPASGVRISRFLPACARRKQAQHLSCPS